MNTEETIKALALQEYPVDKYITPEGHEDLAEDEREAFIKGYKAALRIEGEALQGRNEVKPVEPDPLG